jgi:hypothetical protein
MQSINTVQQTILPYVGPLYGAVFGVSCGGH